MASSHWRCWLHALVGEASADGGNEARGARARGELVIGWQQHRDAFDLFAGAAQQVITGTKQQRLPRRRFPALAIDPFFGAAPQGDPEQRPLCLGAIQFEAAAALKMQQIQATCVAVLNPGAEAGRWALQMAVVAADTGPHAGFPLAELLAVQQRCQHRRGDLGHPQYSGDSGKPRGPL